MNANSQEASTLTAPPQVTRVIAQQHPIFDALCPDKTEFTSRLRIARNVRNDPDTFARKTDLPLRSVKPHRAWGSGSSGRSFSLDLLTYGGITLKIFPPAADGLSEVQVTFNPGRVLYGHNGRILTYNELLDALSIYITHAKHLLEDSDDWIDLVPGLRAGGPGRWTLLELPYHCRDTDGSVLAALRHLRHPKIRTQARHWPDSIELGGKRAKLQFSIYRKAAEMFERGKLPDHLLPHYADILRLEARLKGKTLVHYVGSDETVDNFDGEMCLVRFFPDHVFQARRRVFHQLEGVWHSDEVQELTGQLAPLGSLIAHIARDPRVGLSFPELLRHVAFYSRVGSKRDTIRTIRGAGAGEMSHRATLSFDELFGDAAYNAQPSIAIPEIERKVSHRLEDIRREPLLEEAYLPRGYVPSWSNPFPSYCR